MSEQAVSKNTELDNPISIDVQEADFDLGAEYQALSQKHSIGAVVTFVGKVRDMNLGDTVQTLTLEHYPAMTQKALQEVCEEAGQRWPLLGTRVIHRVGRLETGDQIVLVGVASMHRGAAFEACEFIMDNLKSRAPFWKKETIHKTNAPDETRWIDARQSDQDAISRW